MVEPIQGEAGIKIPSSYYIRSAKSLCEKYNILFICDEVQTGIGRTGEMLASTDVKPDLLILGKALSGGMMPVSCVLGNNEVMDLIDHGTHGSTYGGNPLGVALVPHAVRIITTENLTRNARIQGTNFRNELQSFVERGLLKDVRGVGLLNAIELESSEKAEKMVEKCMENGLLTKVTRDGTIRMCPPLIINEFQMDESLKIIKKSLLSINNNSI
jgi:ornithine--oxo-acid transaminase